MIKKNLFKFTSVFMCAAMMACSLTACGKNAALAPAVQEASQVEQGAAQTAQEQVENAVYSKLFNSSAAVKTSSLSKNNSKEETVFIFTGADGSQDHVIVNEKLRNVTGKTTIDDVTMLNDVTNLTGDETATTGSNGSLTWNAGGSSITYQGTTTEAAPVKIKVTYYLDGKEISAKDLAGKSGKVKIRFDYTNNAKKTITVNGTEQQAYVPFTMITGMALDAEKFKNVEVTNGKIEEGSGSNIVLGITMPGLKESLEGIQINGKKLDLDIPDYFEVTADVTDFELDMMLSVAVSDMLSDIDADEIDLSGIKTDAQTMSEAGDMLSDGASKLADGTAQLAGNVPALTDATAQLSSGAAELSDGAATLVNGASVLKAGVQAYTDGVGQAAEGGAELSDGAQQVAGGLEQLADNAEKELAPGAAKLADGCAQISQGIDKLSSTLTGSFAQIKTEADNYGAALQGVVTQASQIETLVNTTIPAAQNSSINQMLGQLSDTALQGQISLAITPVEDITQNDLTDQAKVTELLTKYMTAYTAIIQMEGQPQQTIDSINQIISLASEGKFSKIDELYTAQIGLLMSAVGNGGVYTALSQVYDQAMTTTDPDTGKNLSESLEMLSGGAKQAADGAAKLRDGIGSFDEKDLASGKLTVCSALYQLKAGSSDLAKGASDLNSGLAQLKDKNAELNGGMADLADGTETLAAGAVQLKEGTAALNGAAGTLGAGVGELNAGAITLRDGMIEFNETGVKKLTGMVGADTENALETVRQIVQLGKDYQSFAGKKDDCEGSVRFIYKTSCTAD